MGTRKAVRVLPAILAVLAVAAVAFTPSRHGADAAFAADATAPVLASFDFTPRSVDVSNSAKTVTFTAEIIDEQGGSGVSSQSCYVEFFSPDSSQSFFVRLDAEHRISGNAQSGRYQFVQTIQAHAAAGSWTSVAWISDVSGNKRSYSSAALSALGFPSTLVVVSAVSDTSPPQLAAFDFTPKTVDVSASAQTITVTARLVDASGAGTYVRQSQPSTVIFRSPSGQYVDAIFDGAHPYTGTAQDGTYREAMVIPAHSEAGTWTVETVLLIDTLLNQKRIGPGTLAALGFPTSFTVISTGADTTPPRLAGFDFTPKTVNTSGQAQTITFTAHITDDISGNLEGAGHVSQLNFRSPSGQEILGASFSRRTSGTPTDGVYTYAAVLPAGSQPGTWVLTYLSLTDTAGNTREMTNAQVAALGFPTSFSNGATTATATPTKPATATATPTQPPPASRTATATAPALTPTASATAPATETPAATGTAGTAATVSPTPGPATPTPAAASPSPTVSATATASATVAAVPVDDGNSPAGTARTLMLVGLAAAFVAVLGSAAFIVSRRFSRPAAGSGV